MLITAIKVKRMDKSNTKMVGVATVTLDNMIAVHDIKILDNGDTMFLAMPSRATKANTFKDIVHPINSEVRQVIEQLIIGAYNKASNAQRSVMTLSLREECASKSFSDLSVADYDEEQPIGQSIMTLAPSDSNYVKSVAPSPKKKQHDKKMDEDFLKWLEG